MTRRPFRRFLSRVLTGIPDTVPPTDPTNLPWTGDVASLAWPDPTDLAPYVAKVDEFARVMASVTMTAAEAADEFTMLRASIAAYDLGLAASPPLSQTPCFRDALVAIGGAA